MWLLSVYIAVWHWGCIKVVQEPFLKSDFKSHRFLWLSLKYMGCDSSCDCVSKVGLQVAQAWMEPYPGSKFGSSQAANFLLDLGCMTQKKAQVKSRKRTMGLIWKVCKRKPFLFLSITNQNPYFCPGHLNWHLENDWLRCCISSWISDVCCNKCHLKVEPL